MTRSRTARPTTRHTKASTGTRSPQVRQSVAPNPFALSLSKGLTQASSRPKSAKVPSPNPFALSPSKGLTQASSRPKSAKE